MYFLFLFEFTIIQPKIYLTYLEFKLQTDFKINKKLWVIATLSINIISVFCISALINAFSDYLECKFLFAECCQIIIIILCFEIINLTFRGFLHGSSFNNKFSLSIIKVILFLAKIAIIMYRKKFDLYDIFASEFVSAFISFIVYFPLFLMYS